MEYVTIRYLLHSTSCRYITTNYRYITTKYHHEAELDKQNFPLCKNNAKNVDSFSEQKLLFNIINAERSEREYN